MNEYTAFGLRVRADLPLPGFPSANGHVLPVVDICRGRVPADGWPALNDDGDHLAGVATGLMRFRVERGERITYDPAPEADPGFLRAVLTGELFSALLRQRGLLVLHGACVARNGVAVGFLGNSGWGKSTLASAFLERGWRLLSDDVLAVEAGDGPLTVWPAYPQMKLRPDAGERFVVDFAALPGAHAQTSKRLLFDFDRFQDAPARLGALFVLESTFREEDRVVSLSPADAFVEVLRHTRVTQLVKRPDYRAAHLRQCSALLRDVPVHLLHRRRSLGSLALLCGLIEKHLPSDDGG